MNTSALFQLGYASIGGILSLATCSNVHHNRLWLLRIARILNIDKTLILFEYLESKTYDVKGSKAVSGTTGRNGWDKRQATLILFIFVDGIGTRIEPNAIFHAATGRQILRTEGY